MAVPITTYLIWFNRRFIIRSELIIRFPCATIRAWTFKNTVHAGSISLFDLLSLDSTVYCMNSTFKNVVSSYGNSPISNCLRIVIEKTIANLPVLLYHLHGHRQCLAASLFAYFFAEGYPSLKLRITFLLKSNHFWSKVNMQL